MTTTMDRSAKSTIEFLARISRRVQAFATELKGRPDVRAVMNDVECSLLESGLIVTIWVESELVAGKALTWWIDLIPRDCDWLIDARVSWDGQDLVIALPEESVSHFAAVTERLPIILDEILNAGMHILEGA